MNWKRLMIGVIIVALLGAGGYWTYQHMPTDQPEVKSDAVDVNTVAIAAKGETIIAKGVVVPLAQALLAFQVNGEVTEILVDEGQSVQKGDTLLRLDSRDEKIAVQQAETAVLQAQASLTVAQAALETAQIELEAANAAVTVAEADLAVRTADPTPEQLALQNAWVAAAAAGVQQAQGNQAVVLAGSDAAAIGVAEAELAAAQSRLFADRLANEPVTQDEHANETDREQAQLRLNASIADVAAAQAKLDALREGATDAERLATYGSVSAANEEQNVAQAQLDLLLAGNQPEAIAIMQANVEQARRQAAETELGVQEAETAVSEAEAGVTEAEVALHLAQSNLDKTNLVAPFAGTVASIPVKVGEVVESGMTVLTLADFSEWQIQTLDLSELDVVHLKRDDVASVAVDVFPGFNLQGHIVDLGLSSDPMSSAVAYAVTIKLDDVANLPLRWGMTVLVTMGDKAISMGTAIQPEELPISETETVFAKGTLEPLHYANPTFQSGGKVKDILVAKGDIVHAGDSLVQLETGDAELGLQKAQAQLDTAMAGLTSAQTKLHMAQSKVETAQGDVTVMQAQLDLLKSGPLPEEIAASQANLAAAQARITQAVGNRDAALDIATDAAVQAAEANLALATADRNAVENKYNTILTSCYDVSDETEICPYYGPVEESTRAELEAARASESAAQAALDQLLAGPTAAQRAAANGDVSVATAKRDVAQAELDLLLAGATPEQIAQAEANVALAKIGVKRAEVEIHEAQAAVSGAEAQVAAAQVAVNAAQLFLDRLVLIAPFDGVVTQIDINPGEVVWALSPVLTLADISGWQVRTADITEQDVALILPGSQVEVNLDAVPDHTIAGTVTQVSLSPGISQGDVVYAVIIRLDPASELPLRWGMTAIVNVDTSKR